MTQLPDFSEPGPANDRVVQMALREIDPEMLAPAMVGWNDADREIVYRNMSERARQMLAEEVAKRSDSTHERDSQAATDFFVQKLVRHRRALERAKTTPDPRVVQASAGSTPDLVERLVSLGSIIHFSGPLALEDAATESDHPILRKGIELVVDGWDPTYVRTILGRMKQTHLIRAEREIDMIVECIESIAEGESPAALRSRLMAFIE